MTLRDSDLVMVCLGLFSLAAGVTIKYGPVPEFEQTNFAAAMLLLAALALMCWLPVLF